MSNPDLRRVTKSVELGPYIKRVNRYESSSRLFKNLKKESPKVGTYVDQTFKVILAKPR